MTPVHVSWTDFHHTWKLLCPVKQEWACPEREFAVRNLASHLDFGCEVCTLKQTNNPPHPKTQHVNSSHIRCSLSAVWTSDFHRQTHFSLWFVPSLWKNFMKLLSLLVVVLTQAAVSCLPSLESGLEWWHFCNHSSGQCDYIENAFENVD